MKPILSALLLLCVAAAALAETCPAQEDIAPCTCQDDFDHHRDIEIQCDAEHNPEVRELDFKAHFATLHGKKIQQLYLYRIPFKRVPTDLFKGMHVRRLDFEMCELEALADKDDDLPFQGLEDSLEYLKIDECFKGANELKHLKLNHLKKLRKIYFLDNIVPQVPNEWFQDGPASLEDISFVGCSVKSVGDKAFAALPNLEYIDFSTNYITAVGRSMVARPALKLEGIFLLGNRISSLSADAFDDMPALTHVDLENNDIRRLPEATWSRVWGQLKRLYLGDNRLECDSHVDWMFGRKRPNSLLAQCTSPKERDGLYLDELIDDHQKNES